MAMARSDTELEIIAGALCELVHGAAAAHLTMTVAERGPAFAADCDRIGSVWEGSVWAAAEHVRTRLYGRPTTVAAAAASPLERAEEAKRSRDIVGEVTALQAGDWALQQAPWYPAQLGDLVIVHMDATDRMPATGDTYVVVKTDDTGELVLQHLHYSGPDDSGGGWYAPGCPDDPVNEPWMEAGQHRLTIVRDGRVVHDGPTAAAAAAARG